MLLTARLGGFAIFLVIAAAIAVAALEPLTGPLRIILGVIQFALFLFALWATKHLLNANGYTRADPPIYVIMAAVVAVFAVSLFTGTLSTGLAVRGGGLTTTFGLLKLLLMLMLLVAMAAAVLLSIRLIQFGRTGGALWRASGAVYLFGQSALVVMMILFIVSRLGDSLQVMTIGGAAGLIGVPLALLGMILHGLALIKSKAPADKD